MALATLAFIDLVSGANAHLTRSVLDAGGAGDLADVAQLRLSLSAHDFAQAAQNPLRLRSPRGGRVPGLRLGTAPWQGRRLTPGARWPIG